MPLQYSDRVEYSHLLTGSQHLIVYYCPFLPNDCLTFRLSVSNTNHLDFMWVFFHEKRVREGSTFSVSMTQ